MLCPSMAIAGYHRLCDVHMGIAIVDFKLMCELSIDGWRL